MRKLFATFLILGGCLATQAQVTVTSYNAEDSTVTINFTYDGARPTHQKVQQAIKTAFDGDKPQNIDPTIADLKGPDRKKKVKTVILTGDWNNVDTDYSIVDNQSIAKIVQEFSDDEHPVTLDLSACQGFESKYVDVRDYYGSSDPRHANETIGKTAWSEGLVSDRLETDFTSLPVPQEGSTTTENRSKPVTITQHSNTVTVSYDSNSVTVINHEVTTGTAFKYFYSWGGEVTDANDLANIKQRGDGSWYIDHGNWQEDVTGREVTTYTYLDVNNNEVTQTDDTTGLTQDSEGNWWYTRYLYQNQNGENVVADNTDNLTPNPNGEGWIFVKATIYTYYDETGNEVTKRNDTSSITSDGNGGWVYNYVTYDYEDENGNQIYATNVYDPHALTPDGNGGYTYNYTETIVIEPVVCFAINKTYPGNLEGIVFPNSDNFTYIPDKLCYDWPGFKKAVLSDKIVAIGNRAFGSSGLEEINFPASLQEIGWAAFKRTNITEADLAVCTNMTRIRFETFEECHSLTTATFPVNLIEIQKSAFDEADLGDVDLSQCHKLRMLGGMCFNQNDSLKTVTLCSHEKTIRGNNRYTTDDSEGAFHLCKAIKKVEVVACEGTCVTECVCENRAFEWDITHYQTAAPSEIMEKVALLIFPEDLPVCGQSPYSSSWDFFVGDYKNGVMITQENLLAYYRHVPNSGTSDHAKVNDYDEDGNKIGEHFEHVECMYQIGNGWHEFIRVGRGEIIKVGEFLRTYSRTAGDGPCQLPTELTAYRAVDYESTEVGWVKDKKNGTHYYDAENDEYVAITSDTPKSLYANGNRYSELTIGGILYLRPLVAKLAQYPGITGGYTGDNIELFDSEEIYSQLTAVPGGHSYVPEETGVVVYSRRINEEAFLMLPGDFGTDVVYKKFPHTGDRYEAARRLGGTGVNTDDDINMLHGSFGTGWKVAPVYPWSYTSETDSTCSGGHYGNPKEFRNFACKQTGTKTVDGKDQKVYGWLRLQPSMMKVNRAFAQIPTNRFDNHNEGVDQMPDFTIEDMPENNTNTTQDGEQTSSGTNLMLLNFFEDETEDGAVVDGIKTVNTNVVKVDDNTWYTIQGVRVAQPTKGVYIHNGKKVVIK